MRAFLFIAASLSVLANVAQAEAAQPAAVPAPAAADPATTIPAPVTPLVELENLVELGAAIASIRYESHNVFIYRERSAELRKAAKALEGGELEFMAKVMRVTELEVVIEIEPAGKTRLIPMHAAHPTFGNLRTVTYCGTSSTNRLHIFSAPIGMRIGSEVSLELAKKLRRRDKLVMRGRIDAVPVWIESVFTPDAVALISNWRVVDVNPEPSY